jgi:hypothetical protein
MRVKLHRTLHYHSVKYILLGVEGYLRDTLPGELFCGQPSADAAAAEMETAALTPFTAASPCASKHSEAAAAAAAVAAAVRTCTNTQLELAAAAELSPCMARPSGTAAAADIAVAAEENLTAVASDVGGLNDHFREVPGFDPQLSAGDVGPMLRLAARNALR